MRRYLCGTNTPGAAVTRRNPYPSAAGIHFVNPDAGVEERIFPAAECRRGRGLPSRHWLRAPCQFHARARDCICSHSLQAMSCSRGEGAPHHAALETSRPLMGWKTYLASLVLTFFLRAERLASVPLLISFRVRDGFWDPLLFPMQKAPPPRPGVACAFHAIRGLSFRIRDLHRIWRAYGAVSLLTKRQSGPAAVGPRRLVFLLLSGG